MMHVSKYKFLPCKTFCLAAVFFLILNGWGLNAFCQADIFPNAVKAESEKYNSRLLSEKLFVHADKSFYMTGEFLWFKIYAVDGVYHQPMVPDKFTYIEVLDKSNTAVLQAKIPMKEGTGNGSFFIPLSLNTGNYTLRAYSNWMKNFDPRFYFEKTITIFNPLKRVQLKIPKEPHFYAVGFFPEGGNLVEGLESKIGVKVTDQYEKGVDFNGYLLDQHNDTIARFKSFSHGMGSFNLTPLRNISYRAVFELPDTTMRISLPTVYTEGFVMHAADTANSQVKIIVRANTSFTLPIYLLAQTGKIVKLAEAGTLSNGEAVFLIDRNKLGEGFSTLTIFDSGRKPVCERLYFKKPAGLRINLMPDTTVLGTRKRLNLNFDVKSRDGKPWTANLSAAVYLIDPLQPLEEMNIVNYLWLSNDIRGVIESPDSYFRDNEEGAAEALENLILTQGWRRFSPQNNLNNKDTAFQFAPEFEGRVVKGKIVDKISGSPVPDISAYLSVPGKQFQLAHAKSNGKGELVFVIPAFYGDNEMIAQIANKADSHVRIEIESPFSESMSGRRIPAFVFSSRLQDIFQSRSIATQVQNIYFGDSLQKISVISVKDSTAFYGRPDKQYDLDAYTRFNSMEEVFREYVQDVILRKSQGKFYFRVLNVPRNLFFEEDPLVLVDGVPVHDIDSIIAFDPLKFNKIEIVSAKYTMGVDHVYGIVSLHTYGGDMAGFPLDPKALVMDESDDPNQGRQYYSPVYDEHYIPNHLPDFRNLLYWSPDLKTGETGSGHFSFYTSDQKGRYAIVVQGIGPDGEAGCGVGFFEVRDDK